MNPMMAYSLYFYNYYLGFMSKMIEEQKKAIDAMVILHHNTKE
jgi:hypothetical protein